MKYTQILVTGGSGFIGSNFIRHVISERPEWSIINLDALTYSGNRMNLAKIEAAGGTRYRFVHGDIRNVGFLEKLFAEHRFDGVFHFAAESHVDRSIVGPEVFAETNVLGTFRLLQAALSVWKNKGLAEKFRFLHVSTDEVYGSLGATGLFTERTAYDPSSPYSASKAASDHFVKAYFRTYGLPTLITNCSNNYGPYQFPEKLIPLMILNIMEQKPLPVYGDGRNVRDWLYVRDHCDALLTVFAGGRPGETYNIGGGAERKTSRSCISSATSWTGSSAGSAAPPPPDPVRHGPAGARPPLRHRRFQDQKRARVGPAARVRGGARKDGRLVPGEHGLGRCGAQRRLSQLDRSELRGKGTGPGRECMNIIPTELEDVILIEPKTFEDSRGFFMEAYHRDRYQSSGVRTSSARTISPSPARAPCAGCTTSSRMRRRSSYRCCRGRSSTWRWTSAGGPPRSAARRSCGCPGRTAASSLSRGGSRTGSAS